MPRKRILAEHSLARRRMPSSIEDDVRDSLKKAIYEDLGIIVRPSDWRSLVPENDWGISANRWLVTLKVMQNDLNDKGYKLTVNLTDARKTVVVVLGRTVLYFVYRINQEAGYFEG